MSEAIARKFHEAYERLAPQFGYLTRMDTRHFDPATTNGKLMIAVCGEVFSEESTRAQRTRSRLLSMMHEARGMYPGCGVAIDAMIRFAEKITEAPK